MSDNIIKNKNREIKTGIINAGKRVAYQPEYERLNIEPTVNKVNPNDFMMAKKIGSRKLSPQQTLPQSGQNEDIIWSQGLSTSKADKISALQENIRNRILEKEDKEAFDSIDDQSSFESVGDYNRKFRYDDIPNAPSALIEDDIGLEQEENSALDALSSAREGRRLIEEDLEEEEPPLEEEEEVLEEQEKQHQDSSFKLSDLRSGDNILLYNDEVICAGSLEEIKDVLSKILLSSNNYLVEEFVVLKRLNIRAGIFIE
jgi:hypothetical protein